MKHLRPLLCCLGGCLLLSVPLLAELPSDRSATTALGDPLACTADVRDQVTRGGPPPAPSSTGAPAPTREGERLEGYVLADSLVTSLFIPAGDAYCVIFDHHALSLVDTLLPYTITATARAAIEIVPAWLRLDLEDNLRNLPDSRQDDYANLILNLDDPRTTDEVAFQVAHLPKTILSYTGFELELLEINAELMYQIDSELQFVEILDCDFGEGNYYSTTRYRTAVGPDTLAVEIPYETYYWWIVMPKVSDERPIMDETVYNMFWREYLYYEHDPGYPLLQEVMQPIQVLWDGQQHDWPGGRPFTDTMLAVDAVGNWCSETVPEAAWGNRPIQPNQIAHEHNGNCGELQDLLCAAARTCLIPTLCTMDILEDHVWCEMWLDTWHPYQVDLGHGATHIDNPGIAYDRDHGGGKDCSCIWDWRNDGFTWDATATYSNTCTLTVTIDDPRGVPVDNAAVVIASEFYYAPYDLYRGTWGETDQNGRIDFILGDNQNYYVRVQTSLGSYPPSGYAAIISGSVAGEHYYWSWTTSGEMTQLDITEDPPGADAVYVLEVAYDLPYDVQHGRDYYAAPYGWYAEKLPGGTCDFFIADRANFDAYLAGAPLHGYLVSENASSNHVFFHPPAIQDYVIVLSGAERHGLAALADVTIRLWRDETTRIPEGGEVAARLRSFPNPILSAATVDFATARPGHYRLAIYDPGGRLLRTLASRDLSSGHHRCIWDGNDAVGRPVASGNYFFLLDGEATSLRKKVTILR